MQRIQALAPTVFCSFLAVTASAYALSHARSQDGDAKVAQVKARYEALFDKQDRAGCVALWREAPGLALATIDKDLEGSLKLAESSPGTESEAQKKMRARAVWGARAAAEALAHPLILDYAVSFVGWNAQQQRQFRDGQSVYKKARRELDQRDFAASVIAGRESVDRALPLGDWWGAAMGYEIQGRAFQSAGQFEDALAAYTMARWLEHDLALRDDEHETLTAIVDMLNTLERPLRGKETVEQALLLARELGDADSEHDLLRRKAEFEDRLGDKAAADATRRTLEALKK